MDNDEPGSSLVPSNTTATVETASTKVAWTTNRSGPPVTGRTAWDALVDVGGMLGRYTPWIIMVAGALYGVYKFTEQEHRAQAEAKDQFQKEIDAGRTELRDTYTQIGAMHSQQLANLMAMLEISKKTAEDTAQKVKAADEAKAQAEKAAAEAKAAEGKRDEAQRELNAAQSTLARKQKDLAEALRQFVDTRRQYGDNQALYADSAKANYRKDEELSERARYIQELKDKLAGVAQHLVPSTDAAVAALGHQIQDEFSLEARKSLVAYARRPDAGTAKALGELVGSSEEMLDTALPAGLGFAFWQKYSVSDGSRAAYIGVVRQTEDTDVGVVLLSVLGRKVQDVDVFPEVRSVAGRDPADWNKPVAYNLYLRPNGEPGVDVFTIKSDRWTVPETETDFADGAHRDIFQSEKPLLFTNLDDFKKKEANVFKPANESNRNGFSDMVAMLENAKTFDAKKIADASDKPMPNGVRETFVALLTESIAHPEVTGVKMASGSPLKPQVFGEIAAIALKTGFRIKDVLVSPATPGSPAEGETCAVVCGYSKFAEPIKYARLTFARQGAEGEWRLLSFERAVELAPVRGE